MRVLRLVSIVFVALVAALPAGANVSIKNGNFFIGYTDIVYSGGFEPKVERVYNSKTNFKGIFGWGWGCEFELHLSLMGDGSLVVHEYGGGADNVFIPESFNPDALRRSIDDLVHAATDAGTIRSEGATAYRERLVSDGDYRANETNKYRLQGLLTVPPMPVGTVVRSDRFSYQYITRVAEGFVRTFDTGRQEQFDNEGRITRITDKNSNFLTFSYATGRLATLVDNFGRKIAFAFNDQGLVDHITGEGNRTATYRYNAKGELIHSRDMDGNEYDHEYDADHNMVRIRYADKTTMDIAYYGYDVHGNVRSVKDRDGTLTTYAYEEDRANPRHYTARADVKDSDGKPVSVSSYEYFEEHDQGGRPWTARLVTVTDGDKVDTTYNQKGLPLSIKHGDDVSSFEYDAKGHVTKKVTPQETTELTYDDRADKVSQVRRYPAGRPQQASWSRFTYDSRANLVAAQNSEGKTVTLRYDNVGRIVEATIKERTLRFTYDNNSKPTKIEAVGLGTITVSYTEQGEIDKVDSDTGRKTALAVTDVFQQLKDIIRPAGVSLSF